MPITAIIRSPSRWRRTTLLLVSSSRDHDLKWRQLTRVFAALRFTAHRQRAVNGTGRNLSIRVAPARWKERAANLSARR
jgi:hypothetical protein